MGALCKALTKSAGIGLSITAVCKNAEKKTLGHDDFFVMDIDYRSTINKDTIDFLFSNVASHK